MSAETEGYVWRSSPYRGTAFAIHLALGDIANDTHGYELWTSASEIAKKARTTRQTVVEVLALMVGDGLLERLSPDTGPIGKPVRYRFLMPALGVTYQPKVSALTTPRVSAQVTPGVGSPDRGGVGSGDTELKGLNSKELKPSKTAGASPKEQPSNDTIHLGARIDEAWATHSLTPAGLQKLVNRYGGRAVSDAVRELHGFPPSEAIRSPFAYIDSMCKAALEVSA